MSPYKISINTNDNLGMLQCKLLFISLKNERFKTSIIKGKASSVMVQFKSDHSLHGPFLQMSYKIIKLN